MSNYAVTPDGRYFVVKGRLWRCSDPSLSEDERGRLVKELMNARRAVKKSKSSGDATELRVAREPGLQPKNGCKYALRRLVCLARRSMSRFVSATTGLRSHSQAGDSTGLLLLVTKPRTLSFSVADPDRGLQRPNL